MVNFNFYSNYVYVSEADVDLTEINDLIKDEMTNFNPFYLYTLTGWDEEKNELNCFEISESFL